MQTISKSVPSEKKAIVAGHFCLDILPDLSNVPSGEFFELFQPGHLLESGKMNIATGGAASNTGISLNKLGVLSTIIARLGNDGFGRIAQNHLAQFVPSEFNHLALVDGETTSYTVIINPPGVDRIFLHHPGANDEFSDEDVDFSQYNDHALFHFGYPQLMKKMYINGGKKLTALFKKAKEFGFTTSLDTTFPDPSSEMGQVDWDGVLRRTLPYVDIFSPSFEEACFMLDLERYSEFSKKTIQTISPDEVLPLIEKILGYGAKIAFLKLGETGGVVGTAGQFTDESFGRARFKGLSTWKKRLIWAPSFMTDVVGTTGAGDATIAGFIGSILNEMTVEESLMMAMGTGGCNVEAIDSVSAVRSWAETAKRINEGWQQNPVDKENFSDWDWNQKFNLWEKKGY